MELRQLRYFIAAADSGSMSDASRKMNVVQSAISHSIAKLEDELGHDLFHRHGRRIRLSAVGLAFLEEARNLLDQADQAVERTRQIGEGRAGNLRVGCQSVACCRTQVSESLRLFRTRFPGISLNIRMGLAIDLFKQVEDGHLDVAFAYISESPTVLQATDLFWDDWALAIPKDDPLLKKKRLSIDDLHESPFIWIPRAVSPSTYDRLLSEVHRHGLTPNIVQEAFDETMMLNLVATGLGVSLLAQSASVVAPEGVHFRKLEDLKLQQRFCFITRAGGLPPPVTAMKSLVLDVFGAACLIP